MNGLLLRDQRPCIRALAQSTIKEISDSCYQQSIELQINSELKSGIKTKQISWHPIISSTMLTMQFPQLQLVADPL